MILESQADGNLKRSVFRKETLSGQSSLLLSLNHFLRERARQICLDKTFTKETAFIQQILKENRLSGVFLPYAGEARTASPRPQLQCSSAHSPVGVDLNILDE